MSDSLHSRPARIAVDPMPSTGHILVIHVTDDLDSFVLRFTSGQAAKLGHRLIAAAQEMERMRPTP